MPDVSALIAAADAITPELAHLALNESAPAHTDPTRQEIALFRVAVSMLDDSLTLLEKRVVDTETRLDLLERKIHE